MLPSSQYVRWISVRTARGSFRAVTTARCDCDHSMRLWLNYHDATSALCAKLSTNMSRREWREWVSPDIGYVAGSRDYQWQMARQAGGLQRSSTLATITVARSGGRFFRRRPSTGCEPGGGDAVIGSCSWLPARCHRAVAIIASSLAGGQGLLALLVLQPCGLACRLYATTFHRSGTACPHRRHRESDNRSRLRKDCRPISLAARHGQRRARALRSRPFWSASSVLV